jgi:hypothetical protein
MKIAPKMPPVYAITGARVAETRVKSGSRRMMSSAANAIVPPK